MKEIKIREYFRTRDGFIGKALKRDEDYYLIINNYFRGAKYLLPIEEKECIVNHNEDVRKLIQIGDIIEIFINGINDYDNTNKVAIVNQEQLEKLKIIDVKYIKSILTKEKFESESYII